MKLDRTGRETYKVSSNEVLVIETAIAALGEDAEVLCQSDENAEEQRNVGANQTEWSMVGHLVVGNALSAARTNKPNV